VEVITGVEEIRETDQRRPIPPTELRPGRYVRLEVRDNGAGMDQATLARIFDPFFTTKFTGRGLGLAAALGIVRGHRGGIEVESLPGQGASFRAYFPVMEGRQTKHHAEGSHENLAGAGLILFVDDEQVVRSVAKATLERYGYTVLLAEDGKQGVEVFAQNRDRVSLIILDMTMPVMSGEEALSELRKIRKDVKIILSSGYSEAEAVRRFTGRELTGFIQKPYTATDLAQKVKDAMGDRRVQPALDGRN
jgi:CheY-like chemotaxis protein